MVSSKIIFDKRVIVASLPFIGYLIAYNYEEGYLSYFHIPAFFVELSLESVIVSTSTVIISLFLLYPFLMVLYPFIKSLKLTDPLHGAFFRIILMFLFFVPFVFIFSTASFVDKLFGSLIILVLLTFYYLMLPLLFFPREKTFRQKLLKAEEQDRAIGNIEDVIRSKPKLYPYWLLLIFALLFSHWASMAGARDAKKQEVFLMQQDDIKNEIYVIIRSYRNKQVAIRIDPENKLILRDFRLLASSQENTYHIKEVGPLDNGAFKIGLTERVINFINRKLPKYN